MKLQRINARLLVALALTGLVAGQIPFATTTAFAASGCGDSGNSKILGVDSVTFVGVTGALLLGYGIYSSVAVPHHPKADDTPAPAPSPVPSP